MCPQPGQPNGHDPCSTSGRHLPRFVRPLGNALTELAALEELGSVDGGRNVPAGRGPRLIVLGRDTLAPAVSPTVSVLRRILS